MYGKNQDIGAGDSLGASRFLPARHRVSKEGTVPGVGDRSGNAAYCRVDDVINGVLLCVRKLHERKLIGPINLGCEDVISIGDLARLVIEISKKKIDMEFDTSKPTVLWGQAVDCNLAASLLNDWKPRIPLREGVFRTYRHIEERIKAL